MKVEKLEKKWVFKIIPESEEDLWTLYKIIEPKDIISGYTSWILKRKDGGKEKIKAWIKISVEEIKFHEYSNMLRVKGNILEASEVVTGKTFTFNIEIGSEFILEKKNFTRYHQKELEKAQKKKRNIIICSLDDKEFCIGVLKERRVEIVLQGIFNISKHDENLDSKYNQKLSEISKIIREKWDKDSIVIIVSPIFWKDKLIKVLNEKYPEIKKILSFSVSKGGKDGIFEFLRRKEYLDSIKEVEIAEVNLKIQEFIEAMSKGYYTAGFESVKYYSDIGAVSFIIVTENFFKKMKEEGKIEDLINLFKSIENNKGNVFFARRDNEHFELIEKLGGIVAVLRYKI